MREVATICPRPMQVDNIFVFIRQAAGLFRHVGYLSHQQQVDLLTLKVMSESRVTWATSVPILVFIWRSVLDLGPIYATDVRRASSHNAPPIRGGGIIKLCECSSKTVQRYTIQKNEEKNSRLQYYCRVGHKIKYSYGVVDTYMETVDYERLVGLLFVREIGPG